MGQKIKFDSSRHVNLMNKTAEAKLNALLSDPLHPLSALESIFNWSSPEDQEKFINIIMMDRGYSDDQLNVEVEQNERD